MIYLLLSNCSPFRIYSIQILSFYLPPPSSPNTINYWTELLLNPLYRFPFNFPHPPPPSPLFYENNNNPKIQECIFLKMTPHKKGCVWLILKLFTQKFIPPPPRTIFFYFIIQGKNFFKIGGWGGKFPPKIYTPVKIWG